jgi:phospholipid/cholesterol/gamma-HCH transport system ATP-binding protein
MLAVGRALPAAPPLPSRVLDRAAAPSPAPPPQPRPQEIRAERIAKSFGDLAVLKGIDLDILRGQIVTIVGASGSGKTVFLDIMTGLMKPDAGRVMVADHSRKAAVLVDLGSLDQDGLDRVRLHWAVVFQKNALFSGTVRENISLLLREHTEMSERQIEKRVRESLQAVALEPDEVMTKNRDELSGGMAKRVAIARAIAIDPAVIFYDEPTTGLDPVISAQIHELIYNVHLRPLPDGTARTTVIVTHDKELLRRLQPRVVMLDQGTICYDGSYANFGLSGCDAAVEYLRTMPVLQRRSRW